MPAAVDGSVLARGQDRLRLEIADIRAEALDVVTLLLRSPAGDALPSYEPGAHIDVHLPNGLVRQYSLCGTEKHGEVYRIAVGRAADSRGGSRFIHQSLRIGSTVETSRPRNNFPLRPAARYRFIAGGIGITPILAMLAACARESRPWRLFYCARSPLCAAFLHELRQLPGGALTLHFDDEAGGHPPDLDAAMADIKEDEHVYCCGPQGMMVRVQALAAERAPGRLHLEWFTPPETPRADNEGFDVVLSKTGRRLHVPANRSILEVLEEYGVAVAYGCRSGSCGCCETALVDGVPDHRDEILDDAARAAGDRIMICVSRSGGGDLVLDM